tara:strand:+ start:1262 stop:1819 length:558 start_codon:yes stop_codon:yes gene_type:complete
MIVGYARTSTLDQKAGLEAQLHDLKAVGCERIFTEQVSSVDMDARTQLADALTFIREGDVIAVTKLDRLARSVAHLLELKQKITDKGAHLRILDLGIDTSTPTGELMLTVLGGIAQFERSIMLERQREGIAKAKADGRYKGRPPTARARTIDVLAMKSNGKSAIEISKALGIGRASVYRIINDNA